MYKCLSCGNLFDDGEEKIIVESTGEYFSYCPVCGGDYEEANMCKLCGEWYIPERSILDNYCDSCVSEMNNKIEEFKNTLTDDENKLLEELYNI